MNKKLFFTALVLALVTWFCINTYAADRLDQDELYDMCCRAADEVADGHLSPEMIMAMVEHESSCYPEVSNGSCKGLMQVNDRFFRERMTKYNIKDIYDPYSNILLGTDYVWELFQESEDPYLVLMIYNMGKAKAIKLYDQGIYSSYAQTIMERSAELEREKGK